MKPESEVLSASSYSQLHRGEWSAFPSSENIPVGIFVMITASGESPRLAFVSKRLLKLLNISREELIADPLLPYSLIHPDDKAGAMELIGRCLASNLPIHWSGRWIIDGKIRWHNLESHPSMISDGSLLREGVMTDITEYKLAEAKLTDSLHRELSRVERQRSILEMKLRSSIAAAAVAHEINQPLASILLNCELALAKLHECSIEESLFEPFLLSLAEESRSVVSTIEKMKMLMRNVQTEHKTVDLEMVIKSSLLHLNSELRNNQITLTHNGFKECFLEGDDAQIQFALLNVIRNAIESIELSGNEPREIRIDLEVHDEKIDVIIGDSGVGWKDGVPSELLITTKPTGSGIGLFVAHSAMKNHSGNITFGISPLGGAEVVLSFPR